MIFKKDKTYDLLKNIALILPLFILLYKSIGEIWEIPYTNQIISTLLAINTFIAGVVKLSNAKYNKTELIDQYDQEEDNSMEIETDEKSDEDV